MAVSLLKPGTYAWRVFLKNLRRAGYFVDFFDQNTSGRAYPTKPARELLCSVVVFSVSALDAYLRDLIVEVVCDYAMTDQGMTDRLGSGLRQIGKENPDLALRIALAPDQAGRKEAFRQGLHNWLSDRSLQGPRRVEEVLGYVDCSIRWSEFSQATGHRNAREALEEVTKQRHNLVHRYDWRPISREEAVSALELIKAIGSRIDQRVCERYGIPRPRHPEGLSA